MRAQSRVGMCDQLDEIGPLGVSARHPGSATPGNLKQVGRLAGLVYGSTHLGVFQYSPNDAPM